MSDTMTTIDGGKKTKSKFNAPETFGAKPEDLTPAQRAHAITGYDLRSRIEALIAGITGKEIKTTYYGTGAATGHGMMILPSIPQARLFTREEAQTLLGYTAHEISHQLETDFSMIPLIFADIEKPTRREQQLKEWWNAIEDYRIEKLTRREFPGFPIYIGATRHYTAKRFVDMVGEGHVKPEMLENPYRIGAVGLTWVGAILNGYPTKSNDEALSLLHDDLEAWLRGTAPRLALVESKHDALDLAKELLDELEQNQTDQDQQSSQDQQNQQDQKSQQDQQNQQSSGGSGSPQDQDDSKPEDSQCDQDANSGDGTDGKKDDQATDGNKGDNSEDADANGKDEDEDSAEGENGSESSEDTEDGDNSDEGKDDGATGDEDSSDDAQSDKSEGDESSDSKSDEDADTEAESDADPDAGKNDNASGADADESDDSNQTDSDGDDKSESDTDSQDNASNSDNGSDQNGPTQDAPNQDASEQGSSEQGDPSGKSSKGGQQAPAPKTNASQADVEAEESDLRIDNILEALAQIASAMDNVPVDIESDVAGSNTEVIQRSQRRYSELKRTVGSAGARSAGVMRRLLAAKNQTHTRRNLEQGRLDLKRLVPIANGSQNVYYEKSNRKDVNSAVSILVDNSISMSGHPIRVCQKAAIVLDSAISGTGTDLEVSGFTGNDSQPTIYQYRRFGQKSQAAAASLGHMEDVHMGGTPVSVPILEAHRRLMAHKANRKIMIIISDGAASDPARAKEAHDVAVATGCIVFGLGISSYGAAIGAWCENHQIIQDIDDLPTALTAIVQQALSTKTRMAA